MTQPPSQPVFIGSDRLDKATSLSSGAPRSYPPDVLARLEVDAKEIIGRYPDRRSALLPLLHLVQGEDST